LLIESIFCYFLLDLGLGQKGRVDVGGSLLVLDRHSFLIERLIVIPSPLHIILGERVQTLLTTIFIALSVIAKVPVLEFAHALFIWQLLLEAARRLLLLSPHIEVSFIHSLILGGIQNLRHFLLSVAGGAHIGGA